MRSMLNLRSSVLGLMALGLLLAIPVVGAHGSMTGSIPSANSHVSKPPRFVLLQLSGPIEVSQSRVRVFDLDGTDHAIGTLRATDNQSRSSEIVQDVNITGNGTYTVAWEALWVSDGHHTQGGYAFAVGNANLSHRFVVQTSSPWPPVADSIARGVALIGWLAATGLAAYPFLIADPAWRDEEGRPPQRDTVLERLRRPILLASGLAVLGTAALFFLSAANTTYHWYQPFAFMADTEVGLILGIRVLLAVGFHATAHVVARRGRGHLVVASLGVLGLASITMLSHARESGLFWMPLVDWVHLVAAATWFGLLLGIVFTLRAAMERLGRSHSRAYLAAVVGRASKFALTSVIILAVSGTLAAIIQVGSFDALFGEIYGRILIVKLLFFTGLLGFGAVNRQFFEPAFRRPEPLEGMRHPAVFRKSVIAEAILVCLVLMTTGVLSGTAPHAGPAGSGLTLTGHGDTIKVRLHLDPGAYGVNAVTATITDRSGRVLKDITNVTLTLNDEPDKLCSDPQRRLGCSSLYLNATSLTDFEGNFTVGIPGTWLVSVYVQMSAHFDDNVDFKFNVARPLE